MSDVKRGREGLVVERDELERLSADDMATQREAEFLADALQAQRLAAAGQPAIERGVCVNCGERCMSSTVYCDPDCRADHEARERATARQRKTLG